MYPFFLEIPASKPSEGILCCAINRHTTSATLRCELPGTRKHQIFRESIQAQTVLGYTPNASETSPMEKGTKKRVKGKPHALCERSGYFLPRTSEKNSLIELPSDW